jgi:calcineurin-like phosphoesterase family protein
MATRSRIGKQLEDGSIKFIYCHWDGYPEHNGVILKEHYTTDAKVDELLALGDLSSLGEEIGEQQDFNILSTHNDKWCLAYGRDRGEKNVEATTVQSLQEMIEENYHYVWNNGKWHCYGGDGRELVF